MRLWKVALAAVLAAVLGAGGYVWTILHRPASANPGPVETFVANVARNMGMPGSYRELPNPLQATPANIQAGMAHFSDHCAVCHGNDGGGDTLFGRGLYPKPPDLRGRGTQHKSDGELYYIIENGIPLTGMPAFAEHPGVSDDLESWHLVIFLRHLPSITQQELAQMAALNPKTDADRQEEKEEQEFLKGGPSTGSSSPNAQTKSRAGSKAH